MPFSRPPQRELISNANDALEKLRLVSLTDKDIIDSSTPLNISIKTIKNEDGNGGKLIITGTFHSQNGGGGLLTYL
jgi:heat shock protein beta